MALLIDGYNVLHDSGIWTGRPGPGMLERWRGQLLRLLARLIEPPERARTTIVFDARREGLLAGSPGDVQTQAYESMAVQYASGYEDADAWIEQLIARHPTPKQLTVVSSDRRIQRAARRRRARWMASEAWLGEMQARCRAEPPADEADQRWLESKKRAEHPLDADEVERWLDEFRLGE